MAEYSLSLLSGCRLTSPIAVHEAPVGWPLLAREQDWYANGSLHRGFGYLRQRKIHWKEARLEQLGKKLMELERYEEAHNSDALRSLTPWQLGLEGSEKDKLMQEISSLSESYGMCILSPCSVVELGAC